jgi:divalent metal cation (Fe/Co/Zn/Cd) transporter
VPPDHQGTGHRTGTANPIGDGPAGAPDPSGDREADLRRALRWSLASVGWTVASSSAAVGTGLASRSLLLVVFGLVGALDLVGSAVLALHFRHALQVPSSPEHGERRALTVIAAGMGTIAAGTAVVGTRHLLHHGGARPSGGGTVVVGTSMVALAVLATAKARVGRRLGHRALLADSHVSAMGSALAAFTVLGAVAIALLGWWWFDPAGSLAVALVAAAVAAAHLLHARHRA